MSTISVTNINDGDAVTGASINNQVNTIVNDYNGNITAANLAANAVTTAKITNANITPDKLGTGAATAIVATLQTTTSTSYADLATVGPAVTVTIGANGLALVGLSSYLGNSLANNFSNISFAISGATTQAANDNNAVALQSFGNNAVGRLSGVFLATGLTAGSNTFTAKYSVGVGGTSTYQDRRIVVVPL